MTVTLNNPLRSELSALSGARLKLLNTRMGVDYCDGSLRVAVFQRYLNDTGYPQSLTYRLPLDGEAELLDFQTVTNRRVSRFSQFTVTGAGSGGPRPVELGTVDGNAEIEVRYAYMRLAAPGKDNKLVFRIPGHAAPASASASDSGGGRPNELFGCYFRGSASFARVKCLEYPLYFEGNETYPAFFVCPDSGAALEAMVIDAAERHREELESGEKKLEDVIDFSKNCDFHVLTDGISLRAENVGIKAEAPSAERISQRGEIFSHAKLWLEDDSNQFAGRFLDIKFDSGGLGDDSGLLLSGADVSESPEIPFYSGPRERNSASPREILELLENLERSAKVNIEMAERLGYGRPGFSDILSIFSASPLMGDSLSLADEHFTLMSNLYNVPSDQYWAVFLGGCINAMRETGLGFGNIRALLREALSGVSPKTQEKLWEKVSALIRSGKTADAI
ncbi:MAG: hypothetical protein LBW85_06605 [Deltaproteobacteria bacterium]|jgi:hypothetical protein|nr:hypothetical protein [Deltaproteobacteria bacterium]